ncbi:MAG: phosphoesterase [Chloroflexi bacterium]|nr:phosphoesterase [Chloroflexota bacterium]
MVELSRTLTGFVTPADKATNDYLLLPFEVPPGVGRLTVRYTYTHRVSAALPGGSGNVVDIGVFDPRGAAVLQGHGFRGWSGSDRSQFTIGLADATPGYLPGPIYPGTWHIILGLYHILPQGCHYHVGITLSEEQGGRGAEEQGSKGAGEQGRGGAVCCGPRWYRGDLQSHTYHSDGTGSVADLAAAARAQRLDFVAVTDHNTVSHWAHLAAAGGDDLLLIPGQEITTYYGHANAWGARGWQEFRCRDDATMARIIDAVHASGGLFSVNHPKDNGPAWEYSPDLPFDCVEVWQGLWAANNWQSVDFWDSLLRQGRRVVAVGGSDKHVAPFTGQLSFYDLGMPTTWVYAEELSTAGILAGIRAGHVFISAEPQGPELYLAADGVYEGTMGDEVVIANGRPVMLRAQVVGGRGLVLRIVSGEGVKSVAVEGDDFTHRWQARPQDDTFYRLELVEPSGGRVERDAAATVRRALTNPIYVTIATPGRDG